MIGIMISAAAFELITATTPECTPAMRQKGPV
jgi:hypothetical protein